MYEGETEPIPRVVDAAGRARHGRDEPDEVDERGPTRREPRERTRRTRNDHDEHEVALPTGHGHGHGHTPAEPVSRRVRTIIAVLLIPFAVAAAVGTVWLYPFGGSTKVQAGVGTPVDGVVTAASTGACNGDAQADDQSGKCLVVTVRMTEGAAANREIRTIVPIEPATPRFAVDDKVVLAYGGGNPTDGRSYQLVDFQRNIPLVLLAGLFALAVLVLGRWQGVKALAALVISFAVLVFFVLPAVLAGESPLLVAVVGAGLIMFVVLYLTHGLTARTSTAVLGTMVSLTLIGVLGALWAAFARLTGIDEDTATLVGLLNRPIDTRGLLLAGVVIGALGVLDDVTVTQTSAVWELRAANPSLTRRQLYAAGLRIGRDHVASAVNTLVMAYAGAALPLLLYSSISGVGIGNILTSQSVAQEIVRTLVGSIGLVAAVPLTTALAAAVAAQEKPAVEEEPAPRKPRQPPAERDRPAGRPRAAGGERSADQPRDADRERERSAGRRRDAERERLAGRSQDTGGTRSAGAPRDADRERERSAGRRRDAEREWPVGQPRDAGGGRSADQPREAGRGERSAVRERPREGASARDGAPVRERAVPRERDPEPDRERPPARRPRPARQTE